MKARCPSKGVSVALKVMALEALTTSLEEIQAEVRRGVAGWGGAGGQQ